MANPEKTLLKLINPLQEGTQIMSPPAMLLVTVVYLLGVLSVPVSAPQKLIWLAAYPIVTSEITGIGYAKIFIRSLWILPLVGLIGIFNPIYDTEIAFRIGSVEVSQGWVTFMSIILRGILSFQAILVMIATTGFLDMFGAMRRLGLPDMLCAQMLLTYRYISVMLEEVIVMKRVRAARGYGRKSYPLNMWGRMVGSLLIRATQRATHIYRAMLARGFRGSLPTGRSMDWNRMSVIKMAAYIIFIAILRFTDFSRLINSICHQ